MGKWYRLMDRYVSVLERIAICHEENNVLTRRNVEANERSAEALSRRVDLEQPIDLSAVTEAINGVRDLLGPMLERFRAMGLASTDRTEGNGQ